MAAWRAEAEPRYASDERPVNMARVVRELQNAMPEDGILVVDGGFAAHWTGLLYDSTRSWAHVYCQPRICFYRLRVAGLRWARNSHRGIHLLLV